MKATKKIKKILAADQSVIFNFGLECYYNGFKDGTETCNKVLRLLIVRPNSQDQKWQKRIKNVVLKEYKELGIDPPIWVME